MLIRFSVNATVEQKARLLENKVSENAETIEQLRKERALLMTDHKKLQKEFTQVSEVCLTVMITLPLEFNLSTTACQQAS